MPEIFADSFYWIALANPADARHQAATNFSQTNVEAMLVTTDEVLSEFLNYFSAAGERKRTVVANMFEETMSHPRVHVIPQTRESPCAALFCTRRAQTKATALLIAYR